MNLKVFFFLIICFVVAVYLACSGFGFKLATSETGLEHVGLIFSILSAAIITIMSIIGLNNHSSEDWKTKWRFGVKNNYRLAYLTILFFLYMITLALMVFIEIEDCVTQTMIIGKTLGFLIPLTFLVSLPIPIVLSKFKLDQMNQDIKKARKNSTL